MENLEGHAPGEPKSSGTGAITNSLMIVQEVSKQYLREAQNPRCIAAE